MHFDDLRQRNPYPEIVDGQRVWRWRDEMARPSKRAYKSQTDALRALLNYMAPSWWRRILREFWHDTRGAS